ncbi:MAG TPA: HAD-IC family P-type ATPase, partial [Planctomycetota bacterium]|nr:HAD-IC family P-type ATPase [Planctomycetota bacterium]
TAAAVARELGIAGAGRPVLTGADLDRLDADGLRAAARDTAVFARTSPEHKLALVEALQASGEVVAVTGDGVNDAPALKRADVGVAMGRRGSDVSREVADLVLLDDDFSTIVAAVEEGRGIYANIRSFIRFLFSTNAAEALLVVVGSAAAWLIGLRDATGALLLPLTAVQILWVNLITDGPPALALGVDRNARLLERPPRARDEPLLDRASLRFVVSTGLLKAAVAGLLLVLLPWFGAGLLDTRTAVFVYTAAAQLVFAYPARRVGERPETNRALHLAVLAGIALQAATVLFAPLRALLGLVPLEPASWLAVGGAVLLTWAGAEAAGRRAGADRPETCAGGTARG